MVDRELVARLEHRIVRSQADAHLRRVQVLHEAQKAGVTGSSLFVAIRKDYPPEGLDKTAQFIQENKMP